MRLTQLFLFSALSLLLFCVTCCTAYKTSVELENSNNIDQDEIYVTREKREIDEFYNEDFPVQSEREEEEPGFWDRIVKVAMKLFNRFIEWLNSS